MASFLKSLEYLLRAAAYKGLVNADQSNTVK